jgi:hypothetical protein
MLRQLSAEVIVLRAMTDEDTQLRGCGVVFPLLSVFCAQACGIHVYSAILSEVYPNV